MDGIEQSWAALWRVLVNPSETFDRMDREPSFRRVYLTMSTIILTCAWVTTWRLLPVIDAGLGQRAPVDPSDIFAMKIGLFLGAGLTAALTAWLSAFGMSVVLWFCGMLGDGVASFRWYFTVAGFAAIPMVLAQMLLAIMRLFVPPTQATSLALNFTFMVPGAQAATYDLLTLADPFYVWSIVLIVLGFSAGNRRSPVRVAWVGGMVMGVNIAVKLVTHLLRGMLGIA